MDTKQVVRFSNFEIIRIIAMFLIVISHYAQHGLLPEIRSHNVIVQFLTMYLHTLGAIGVTLFILLTGYFMIESKFKINHFFKIAIETIFYSWGIYLIFVFIDSNLSLTYYGKSLFPILTGQYWFITLYLILYLLIPVFNKLFNSLDKQMLTRYLCLCIVIWFVIPILSNKINLGTSYFLNFVCIYFVGAYIKRYGLQFFEKWQNALLTVVLSEIIIGVYQTFFLIKHIFNESSFMYITWCNSIFTLLTSVSIFMLLKNYRLNYNKFINYIAASTLSVYLITENIILREIIWINIFQCNYSHNTHYIILNMLFAVTISFMVCVLIDKVRIKIFGQVLENYVETQYKRIAKLIKKL